MLSGRGGGFDTWADPDDVEVLIEAHAPESWAHGLTARGHRAHVTDANYCHAHCIEVVDGGLAGAADPRALIGEAAGA